MSDRHPSDISTPLADCNMTNDTCIGNGYCIGHERSTPPADSAALTLSEKLEWVKSCKCERPICLKEREQNQHDQSRTGCFNCDLAHADYPLFTNKEVLCLLAQERQQLIERLEQAMPKKKPIKKVNYYDWDDRRIQATVASNANANGHNRAIDKFANILNQAREEKL